MFKNLSLKATYDSYQTDIAKTFYEPVLRSSTSFDRVSAYFSSKALSAYSKGLEFFSKNGHKYRLIISHDISETDFLEMKTGYQIKAGVQEALMHQMDDNLSLDDHKNLSNLAYLISIGTVDIRMAFTQRGIFHDKFGVCKDAAGDVITFRGSNNETEAALDYNYEAFEVTCSWLAAPFDYQKIKTSIESFEKLWENQQAGIVVLPIPQVVLSRIMTFDKGAIVVDKVLLLDDCLILDMKDNLVLENRLSNPSVIMDSPFYKLRLKRYVSSAMGSELYFNESLTYIDYNRIIKLLKSDSEARGYDFYCTDRLMDFIQSRNIHIDSRSRLGIEIKHQDPKLIQQFLRYKEVVDSEMSRTLRDKQMWDSFFMFAMNKSGNFSVPGSGKTASVLGMFAYLQHKEIVKRIVMIGPKSAFDSWIDEFGFCFDGKKKLSLFSIQDAKYKTEVARKKAIKFDSGDKNLMLFNYESIGPYIEEIKQLIDNQTILVFDEVHKVKAINGYRASLALEVSREAQYEVVMTGTPIPNSYTDIYNMLNMLFREEYREFFGFDLYTLRNPSDSNRYEINERIQPFFCRTTKKQLDVPEANSDIISRVDATHAENKIFKILTAKYRQNKLALIIRVLQMEANPRLLLRALEPCDFESVLDEGEEIEDIQYIDYSEEMINLIDSIKQTTKSKACEDLVIRLASDGKSVIIWCIFIDSIFQLKTILESAGFNVACIHGEVDMVERHNILNQFRSKEVQILITNPHTLAESVSLHSVCHDAVYFECNYNLVHLLQSKDRIHRLGLPEGQYTQYYFFETEYTKHDGTPYSLGEKIHNRLMEKERIMLEAIDNEILEAVSTSEEDLEIIFKDLF